ncbi:ABC transporter ATP-binding protein [Candidatus Fermentibacteria bacterium]|nr:ABC transporter ATP-binding protein [Candidatus Fermentibacteria bacterium]
MTNQALVSAEGLVVRYGITEAVRGISLSVHEGEVVGLIGPDGAGKTSTLRVIAGLHPATAGTVTVLGRDAWRHRRALHLSLGYLAQRFALYGDLTVDENMQFFALLLGVPQWESRRDELLGRVGLTRFHTRLADHLSGGMRQKLALAVSLMHAPRILLLDESTTGVDPITRREFWNLLADLVAEGLTLVLATPYLDEAERCSRVVLMHRGNILAEGEPQALASLIPGAVFEVAATPRHQAGRALQHCPGIVDVQPFAARFHVRVASPEGGAEHIRGALEAAGCDVEDLRPTLPRLEDVFLHLTQAANRNQE